MTLGEFKKWLAVCGIKAGGGGSTPNPAPAVVQTVTFASTVTLDCSAANVFNITLTGPITINLSNGVDGQAVKVVTTQDSTGGRVITWGSGVTFGTDVTAAVASTAASAADYFGLQYNGGKAEYNMVAVARGY